MDPFSITASLLCVVDAVLRTTTALAKYARDTKDASSDRKFLAEETLFLSKLLQRLRDRAEKARSDETWLADHKDIASKLRAARTMLTWSFSKSEIYSFLERITRLQQHANLLLVDDQQQHRHHVHLFQEYETDQTFANVLSSLLQQLLQDSEDIAPDLLSLYERHRDRNTSPTTDEISEALSTMIESHKEVFCVIDALDECHEDLR
ncbi:MAG: hypothetical protein Q9179_005091 [Wetmoreana sp. 5 TL-2023]